MGGESFDGVALMVFPLARDLVDRINQVQREIGWGLFAVRLLRSVQRGFFRRWDLTIAYLVGWCRELRKRSQFLEDNYDVDQVADDPTRDLVITPEDEWARLLPSERPRWDDLAPGGGPWH